MKCDKERVFLPQVHFAETHNIIIDAPVSVILQCVEAFCPQDDPLIKIALWLRGVPLRLAGRKNESSSGLPDFTLLHRRDESLSYGLMGAFWQPDYGLVPCQGLEHFITYEDNTICKLVMSYKVFILPSGLKILTTTTEIFCPTSAVKRRFRLYWSVIRPVSGLIRKRMLSCIRKAAEKRARFEEKHAL